MSKMKQQKTLISVILANILVIFVIPWVISVLVRSSADTARNWGLAPALFLLFILNSAVAALTGILAGRSIKSLWYLPLIPILVFWTAARFLYEMDNSAFFLYARGYLVLGIGAMLLTWGMAELRKKRAVTK